MIMSLFFKKTDNLKIKYFHNYKNIFIFQIGIGNYPKNNYRSMEVITKSRHHPTNI